MIDRKRSGKLIKPIVCQVNLRLGRERYYRKQGTSARFATGRPYQHTIKYIVGGEPRRLKMESPSVGPVTMEYIIPERRNEPLCLV